MIKIIYLYVMIKNSNDIIVKIANPAERDISVVFGFKFFHRNYRI